MIAFEEIKTLVGKNKSFEENMSSLIRLSRNLEKPSDEILNKICKISKCESDLWFDFVKNEKKITAYSNARIMQGVLVIIIAYVEQIREQEQIDLINIFDDLGLLKHLSQTRVASIKVINDIINIS